MTNDYAALVAMLDQAAADLQAEIDAAIDRHGLLVRTAATLRGESDSPERRAARVAQGRQGCTALPSTGSTPDPGSHQTMEEMK